MVVTSCPTVSAEDYRFLKRQQVVSRFDVPPPVDEMIVSEKRSVPAPTKTYPAMCPYSPAIE